MPRVLFAANHHLSRSDGRKLYTGPAAARRWKNRGCYCGPCLPQSSAKATRVRARGLPRGILDRF